MEVVPELQYPADLLSIGVEELATSPGLAITRYTGDVGSCSSAAQPSRQIHPPLVRPPVTDPLDPSVQQDYPAAPTIQTECQQPDGRWNGRTGKDVAKAFENLTGRPPLGIRGPFEVYGKGIAEAILSGRAIVSGLPPVHRVADTLQKYPGLFDRTGVPLELEPFLPRVTLDFHDGFTIDVALSAEIEQDGGIVRTQGTEAWYPPGGLIKISEHLGLTLQGYWWQGRCHEIISSSPPLQVDLRVLEHVPVTVVELGMFFPNHYVWKEASERYGCNGWTPINVASLANQARGTNEEHDLRKQTIGNWIQKAALRGTRTPKAKFTCEDWTPPPSFDRKLIPYYVRDIPEGVRREHFPVGADAGPLTWAIEHVLDHPEYSHLTIGDLPSFIPTAIIEEYSPCVRSDGLNPDVEAFRRHEPHLKAYRDATKDSGGGAGRSLSSFATSSLSQVL
ncbi:Nn.00g030750.m01.CDS01 [Neocucurbitaria sp. VM-36]